ncbi:hypothetical protein JCM10450v2_001367 [Rhodotorula kratochvilovae]
MADEFKAQGNAAFAQKKWLKAAALYGQAIALEKDDTNLGSLHSNRSAAYVQLEQFDEALDDANQAVLKRPDWSKAHARVGEVYARQQEFHLSIQAYDRAIELAEDETSCARYESSRKTTETARARMKKAASTVPQDFYTSPDLDDLFLTKVNRAILAGTYRLDRQNGMAVSVAAAESCAKGLAQVERSVVPMGGEQVQATAFTFAIADICECIITDETAFFLESEQDAKMQLPAKLEFLLKFELQAGGCLKYFTNAVWSPKDTITDLDRRIAIDGQQRIRQTCSALIRGRVVSAFLLGSVQGERGPAILELKRALALLDEGNRKWANKSFDEKGNVFRPTLVRNVRVYLLKNLLAAHRDAKTPSARRAFKLEDVEKLAKDILAECPPSKWPPRDGSIMHIGYGALSNWEAYCALGYVYSYRARLPLVDVASGKVSLCELKAARQAAEYYDKAASTMPWLRAGGLAMRELRRREAEARKCTEDIARFYGPISDDFEPRYFALTQLRAVTDHLRQVPGADDRLIVKAIPTINSQGMPPSWDPASLLDQAFWAKLPGDVGLADVLA